MAVVVKALKAFDAELTSIAPKRTLPTWFLGDARHRKSASGHNADDTPGSKSEYTDSDNVAEIRAGDYRLPLNASFTAEQLIQWLVKECRAGRIKWIAYIIYNKRIWTAKNGWVTQSYNGSNPHDHHFHISCKADTASENSTKLVGLKASFLAALSKPKPTPAKPKPPATGGKLPTYAAGSRTISAALKSVGTDVAYAQRFIGPDKMGPADGRAGAKFTAGVKWYQREIMGHRNPDGVLTKGGPTWKRILSA